MDDLEKHLKHRADIENRMKELAAKTANSVLFLGDENQISLEYRNGVRDTIRYLYGVFALADYDAELDKIKPGWWRVDQ